MCNQKFLTAGEVSWNWGTSINNSSKTRAKKTPQGNILKFSVPDTLKTTIWMENKTQRWTQSGPLFPKSWHFFVFSIKSRVEQSQCQSRWICINIPECLKYSWKCLNKLFWLCQGSQYTSSSEIFDKVLNMPQALNMPELSVCRHIVNATIIIVTNVIILEFFSAQFVSDDAPRN